MSNDLPILVAGGGIAGLAAAIALRNQGHRVEVLEARHDFADSAEQEGAGIQIGPNGVNCLKVLGVADHLTDDVFVPPALAILNARSGTKLATLPLQSFMAGRHGAPYWTLRRQALHAALVKETYAKGGITLHGGRVVAAPRHTARGVVVIAGSDVVEGKALIGADGAGSSIRAFVAPALHASRPLGWSAARAVFQRPTHGPFSGDAIGLWFAPDSHVVHYPVAGGRDVSVVAVTRDDVGALSAGRWDATDRGDDIAQRLGKLQSDLARAVRGVAFWRKWPLFDNRPLYRAPWSQEAAVLVGDAAHPILPYLAQGAVMALEDAVTLGQLYSRDAHAGDVFAAFARHRRPRVLRVAQASRRNGFMYHLGWSLARDLAIQHLPASVQLGQFDWLYGHDAGRPQQSA